MAHFGAKSGLTHGQPHGVIGGKSYSVSIIGSKAATYGGKTKLASVISVPQTVGRGDLGNGNSNQVGGNTYNAVGNAQRDAAPRPFDRDRLLRKTGPVKTLESRKRNKRN